MWLHRTRRPTNRVVRRNWASSSSTVPSSDLISNRTCDSPRRTIATAQSLYHRFHLHFPLRDFAYQVGHLSFSKTSKRSTSKRIVTSSRMSRSRPFSSLQSSKTHSRSCGTFKSPGPRLQTSWKGATVRARAIQPCVLSKAPRSQRATKGLTCPRIAQAQEAHRPQLIGIERLILQTICFNFTLHRSLTSTSTDAVLNLSDAELAASIASAPTSKDIFSHLLRLSALLPLASGEEVKSFTYLAFLLATDLFRTLSPLSYPPHTCAAACLRLAFFLFYARTEPSQDQDHVGTAWSQQCESRDQDLDGPSTVLPV